MRLPGLVFGVVVQLAFAPTALPADGRSSVDLELVLLYDFYGVEGSVVPDGSGHGHEGAVDGGEVVSGRDKPAVAFGGKGQLTMVDAARNLDLAAHPLTVGAMCRPGAPDGVIISMGDAEEGFSLYLKDGIPHFAVRTNGVLGDVADVDPVALDQWVHVAGVVDEAGKLSLLINTWPVNETRGHLLTHTPAGPLTVGADPGAGVGEYAAPLHWQGFLQDVRLYRGTVSRQTHRSLLGEWAQRPGCGTRR